MIYTRQDRPSSLARWTAKKRAERRGIVSGFVGQDNRTHAVREIIVTAGTRTAHPRCDAAPTVIVAAVAFIANPQHRLCLACVSALEDEIRRDT